VWGAYVQNHIQLAEPLLLSLGLRYDNYELEQVTFGDDTSSSGVSGNIGLRFDITPSLAFSVGHAQALRGKEVGDAFTLERRPGRITLAPGLDPERVDNTEAGLAYDDGRLRASASVFAMEISDVILDQIGGGPAPQDAVYYENVGAFESEGFELQLGYSWETFSADLFYTSYDPSLNGREVEGYEEIGLANASGDQLNLYLGWAPTDALKFGWNTRVVEDLNDITVLYRAVEIGWIDELQTIDKPGYTVSDIYMEWTPRSVEGLRLNLAVNNIFDEHYRDHASVGDYNAIPDWEGVAGVFEAGRDIRVSAAFAF
jgi:hemoglobin/transferrin/lactoferrin receptor protein